MRLRTGLLPLLAVSAFGAGKAQATQGYFADGYGIQSKGEAGVVEALPQDSLAIATNPAAASVLGNRVDFDADVFLPQRSASISQGGVTTSYNGNKIKIFIIPEAGIIYQLPHNLSAGLAVYGNGGLDSNYGNNPYARFGATAAATMNLQQIFVSPTIAWEFAPGQSIGVSFNLADEFFRTGGIAPFSGYSDAPASFNHRGEESGTGYGVRVGYLGQITPWLSVGASWQSVTYSSGFGAYRGLFADHGGFDIPSTYGAGIGIKPLPGLEAGLDVQRIDYRSVHSVGDSFQTVLSGVPFGADNGPGFGWKNTTTVKFGASYQLLPTLTVRGGYSYTTQPIPKNQTLLNILAPGVVQNQFSAGLTYTSAGGVLPAGLQLSAYAAYALPQTVHGANSIPTAFGGGNANIKLTEKTLGLGVGYKF
jgi:long-chain fatty acid transport protein